MNKQNQQNQQFEEEFLTAMDRYAKQAEGLLESAGSSLGRLGAMLNDVFDDEVDDDMDETALDEEVEQIKRALDSAEKVMESWRETLVQYKSHLEDTLPPSAPHLSASDDYSEQFQLYLKRVQSIKELYDALVDEEDDSDDDGMLFKVLAAGKEWVAVTQSQLKDVCSYLDAIGEESDIPEQMEGLREMKDKLRISRRSIRQLLTQLSSADVPEVFSEKILTEMESTAALLKQLLADIDGTLTRIACLTDEDEDEDKGRDGKVMSIDLLDVLLDPENREPIVFEDGNGKQITFEQIAVIPYEVRHEKRLYCILKPADHIEGIADDEAIPFRVITNENGDSAICMEEDEQVAVAVFQKYYDLLEEARRKNDE